VKKDDIGDHVIRMEEKRNAYRVGWESQKEGEH
jgi:hypothetical protein